ncbi:MAG TPA: polyprenyl synthetase family protein [Candidatus Saccharimonadales bacterium]|nr:polyprenyl synthetase family protein [Candidatus Saccharimonadales bacterium]
MRRVSPPTAAPADQAHDFLAAYTAPITAALEQLLTALPADAPGVAASPTARLALDRLREYSLRPGKRLRGTLAAAAYDQTAGTTFDPVGITLGAVQELLQSYLLIIDDVMDDAPLRRGKPSMHTLYEAEAGTHHGQTPAMLAVCVGMVAQHLASVALADLPTAPARRVGVLCSVHTNLVSTWAGQMEDLAQRTHPALTADDILRTYALKTGYYTFVGPLQAGLALAGATDPVVLATVRRFGEAAGVAFQLQDDLLDCAVEADTGKPQGTDLQEGVQTLLAMHVREHGRAADRAALRHLLGNTRLTRADIDRARQMFADSGATAYVTATAQQYAERAKRELAEVSIWDGAFKATLSRIVDYAMQRRR